MFRILEKIKLTKMKTLFLLILAATMFAACEKENIKEEEPTALDSMEVKFTITRNFGIITQAYIADAKDNYKDEIKVDYSASFTGKTVGDTSNVVKLKIGKEYRIYIYDNNNWAYYSQPFAVYSNYIDVNEMVRFK